MMRKLFSRRGETLTELLISVLVITLGLTMFATAVMAARRMNELGASRVESYYTGRNNLEKETAERAATLILEETGKGRVNLGAPSANHSAGSYPVRLYYSDFGKETILRYGR